jgi:CRISPR type III-A-associated protein Csm2
MANERKFSSFAELSPQGQGSGGRHGGPPPRGRPGDAPELPPGYLAAGYFDQKNNLLKDIFVGWPEAITRSLRESRPPATKNSLRAFYTMLRMAKNQFEAQRRTPDKAMGEAKTQLYKLRTAAQYQRTRNVISPLCQDFLAKNIDLVDRKGTDFDSFDRNFNAFVEHFQAVIAYLPERAQS